MVRHQYQSIYELFELMWRTRRFLKLFYVNVSAASGSIAHMVLSLENRKQMRDPRNAHNHTHTAIVNKTIDFTLFYLFIWFSIDHTLNFSNLYGTTWVTFQRRVFFFFRSFPCVKDISHTRLNHSFIFLFFFFASKRFTCATPLNDDWCFPFDSNKIHEKRMICFIFIIKLNKISRRKDKWRSYRNVHIQKSLFNSRQPP